MPWLDPARSEESAEDRELRDDLRRMLALPQAEVRNSAPTPEMIALAEDLRREALRRQHTPVLPLRRTRPTWTLLAAGLPVLLLLGGMGAWGVQQKRKADALAATLQREKTESERRERAIQAAQERERALRAAPTSQGILVNDPNGKKLKPRQLVLPADSREQVQPMDTYTVKNRK